MQPIDQGSILRSGAAVVPDFANQMLQRQQMQLMQREQAMQGQQFQLKQAQDQRKLAEDASYEASMQEYLADPKPERLIGLMAQYPDRHEGLKKAYDASKGESAANDLQQSVEVYSLAKNGRIDKASERLKARIAADEAAGMDVSQDREVLAMLQDPETQKQALGLMEMSVALAMGQDKFTDTFKALNPDEKMSPFMREYNDRVAQFGKESADAWRAVQDEKFVPVDGIGVFRGSDLLTGGGVEIPSKGGGQVSSGGGVATALSSHGFPPAVVAGFLGNFQHESNLGQNKGSGDGGTAHGLAQWRNERVSNFKRVIGKHPNDASLDEQVKFVAWEMQNPAQAGMTVAQRDAILAAKTPEQAAALIDKYYERSNGKSRNARAKAARGFFTGNKPVSKKVGGKTYYEIDGKWYDNPEGK